jgi:hypothetical protein
MSWNAIGYTLLVIELILLVSLPRAWVKLTVLMLGVAATTGLLMIALLAMRFFAAAPASAG